MSVFWVGKVLLLFRLITAISSTESKKEDSLTYIHFMKVRTTMSGIICFDASVHGRPLGTKIVGLWILLTMPVKTTSLRVNTTKLCISSQS